MENSIKKIFQSAIEELNEQLEESEKIIYSKNVKLIGSNAALDSMAFVTLVTIIEELVEDELDVSVEIVSDKAFSRTNSPFSCIGMLEEFVLELVREAKE